MKNFQALRVHEEDGRVQSRLETISLDDLASGEVVIRAAYSDINYKDALAITGKGRIIRNFPAVAGIDVAGEVLSSDSERFSPGDTVLVTGCGLGETHDGGYAEYVRVPADWVVPLPEGLTAREAMAIGTAGFTAALALERMQRNGSTPADGPILINGATGGVGSIAIDIFAQAGFSVTALTAKADQVEYLKELGAQDVLLADQVEYGRKPLENAVWAGAVDSLGGEPLAWLTRTVKPWGNIAAIGLAAGHQLDTTVMPFILRSVSLLGVDSVHCPYPLRQQVWNNLASVWKPRHLDTIVRREVGLGDVAEICQALLQRQIAGRTLVRIGAD